jgi:predicted ATPase
MRLTHVSRFKSILDLPPTELPSFTLITGVNGAGKTHLLQAIQAGSVHVDIAPEHLRDPLVSS